MCMLDLVGESMCLDQEWQAWGDAWMNKKDPPKPKTVGVAYMLNGDKGASNFFSSNRRRHTRCRRDWSSDVCSSDLTHTQVVLHDRTGNAHHVCFLEGVFTDQGRGYLATEHDHGDRVHKGCGNPGNGVGRARTGGHRSEERRVGKEGECGRRT